MAEHADLADGPALQAAVKRFSRWPSVAELDAFFAELRSERHYTPVSDDDMPSGLAAALAYGAIKRWALAETADGATYATDEAVRWLYPQVLAMVRRGDIAGRYVWTGERGSSRISGIEVTRGGHPIDIPPDLSARWAAIQAQRNAS